MLFQYSGRIPISVEGFPVGCERSVAGAVYLMPGTQVTMTAGEWGYVEKAHPGVAQYLSAVPIAPPPPLKPVKPIEQTTDDPPKVVPHTQPKVERPSKAEGDDNG